MINEKNTKVKCKHASSSIVMYIIAGIIVVIAAAALFNDFKMFKAAVGQYVASGYDVKDVISLLLAQQLLPGIFQVVALYGGIAAILIFGGIINNKVSICLKALNKEEPADSINESIEKSPKTADGENESIEKSPKTADGENESIEKSPKTVDGNNESIEKSPKTVDGNNESIEKSPKTADGENESIEPKED